MPNSPATWLVAQRPWRMALLLLLLAMVVEYAIMLLLPDDLEQRIGRIGVAAVDAVLLSVLLMPCLWWLAVKPLHRLADARRQLLDWALQSEERRAAEIARDLHDDAGQLAAALNIGLRTIEDLSSDHSVAEQTRHLRQVGKQLHETIRDVSRGIRPRSLDSLGLAAAIAAEFGDTRLPQGPRVTADVSAIGTARLQRAVETAIFRVVQESVINAGRHAHAENVRIRLWRDGARLCCEIVDDGCGFDVEATMSEAGMETHRVPFGLYSIRERVELLGGRVVFRSQAGKGTSIAAWVPWVEADRT